MRIVVSGFEPFGGRAENRSLQLAKALARSLGLSRRTLPVRFARLPAAVARVAREAPDFWLMLGESGRAETLRLESRAVNEIDARIPDNDGLQPRGVPVCEGPKVRRTRFAAPRVGARSHDAGRYACNAAYYLALSRMPPERVLFVHVPAERADDAALLEGLAAIVRSASRSGPRAGRSSASQRSGQSSRRTRR